MFVKMKAMLGSRHVRVLQIFALCCVVGALSVAGQHRVHARPKPGTGAVEASIGMGPAPTPPIGSIDDAEPNAGDPAALEPAGLEMQSTVAPAAAASARDGTVEYRVLLIGNSYTLHNTLRQLLSRLSAAVEGGPHLVVDVEARGGYSLRNHLRTGLAMQRIRSGHYTHVVLQGHSMSAIDHPDELSVDAERFKLAIDAVSSRTIFYATWARSPEVKLYKTNKVVHSFAEMSDRVSMTYAGLSTRLNAGLAPVGRAFERALVEQPHVALWGSDGSHPTLAGSYMAACVLYDAITGVDPERSTFIPLGLDPSTAVVLRAIAAESFQRIKPATLANTVLTTAAGPT
jgi:hypothetical protein